MSATSASAELGFSRRMTADFKLTSFLLRIFRYVCFKIFRRPHHSFEYFPTIHSADCKFQCEILRTTGELRRNCMACLPVFWLLRKREPQNPCNRGEATACSCLRHPTSCHSRSYVCLICITIITALP